MKSFRYVTATTPASARELAGEDGAYFAGGIDLLGEMKEYIAEPKTLVNIKELPELKNFEKGSEVWRIGANVTIAQLEDDADIRQTFPGLHQAAAEVGSRQIRNVATLGGNLAQHSRCWYYRHRDVFCLKKGGDTCYARNGENRYHSLFTGNTCISPVVSNLAVALASLDATVLVQRGSGQPARLTIAELYAKAWENPTAQHSLDPTDLILEVEVPTHRNRSSYLQMSEKGAFDWALVSCAAAASLQNGKLTQARVVLGAVANVPYQVEAANRLLEGQTPTEDLAKRAADEMLTKAQVLSGNGYKLPIARALIMRALMQLKA